MIHRERNPGNEYISHEWLCQRRCQCQLSDICKVVVCFRTIWTRFSKCSFLAYSGSSSRLLWLHNSRFPWLLSFHYLELWFWTFCKQCGRLGTHRPRLRAVWRQRVPAYARNSHGQRQLTRGTMHSNGWELDKDELTLTTKYVH